MLFSVCFHDFFLFCFNMFKPTSNISKFAFAFSLIFNRRSLFHTKFCTACEITTKSTQLLLRPGWRQLVVQWSTNNWKCVQWSKNSWAYAEKVYSSFSSAQTHVLVQIYFACYRDRVAIFTIRNKNRMFLLFVF